MLLDDSTRGHTTELQDLDDVNNKHGDTGEGYNIVNSGGTVGLAKQDYHDKHVILVNVLC